MATSDTSRTDIVLGARGGKKQAILTIPAQAAANKPGIINLQSATDGAATEDRYLWVDSTGVLRINTSVPTNQDSDGAAVAAASAALPALSNLAAVAINTSLISDTANTDDLGSDPISWRTLYWTTSLKKIGTTYDVTLAATEPAAASYTYTFPDAGAAANVMLDTGATNVIAYTKGTSTIAMAANADIDIATGVTLHLDTALTVNTTAVTLNQSLSTTDAPVFATGTVIAGITLATGAISSSSGAISFDNENLTTTGTINLAANNVNITVGAAGATNSRIYFDGAGNLMFYDSNLAAARSLTELYTGTSLNPAVAGNLTVGDGNFTWTNTSAAETAVFTLAATTVDGIQINSSNTTADVVQITGNATVGGNLLSLISVDATMTSGAYIYCYDGGAQDFAVRRYGATTIAGSAAGTAALTLTTGDIAVSSGYLNLDSPVGNGGHNIATSDDGTSNTAFMTITNSNVGFDQPLILVNADATGAIDAVQITHDSTGYGLSVVGSVVTGKQAYFAGPAAQSTSIVVIDGTTGTGWDGASGVGMLNLAGDGAHIHAGASLLNITDGTGATIANARGFCLRMVDTTTAGADAWTAYLSTTNNDGLLIETGEATDINLKLSSSAAGTNYMLHVDGSTGTWVGASNVGAVTIDGDGVLAAGASLFRVTHGTGAPTAQSYMVEIEATGTWAGSTDGTCLRILDSGAVAGDSSAVYINSTANNGFNVVTQAVAAMNILASGVQGQVAPIIYVDGTTGTGWVGTSNTGMLQLSSDGTNAHASSSLLYITKTGATVAAMTGSCLAISDASTGGATGGYAVYINASGALEALNVAAGTVVVAETVTATGGIKTKVAVTDVADPPTQNNMISAFGTAASAGAGFIGIINDANGGINIHLCISDGANWFYITKATVGA